MNNKERVWKSPGKDTDYWKQAFSWCIQKTESNIQTFHDGTYPAPSSKQLTYPAVPNNTWTSSFWNGMLWLAYENTGKAVFRQTAERTLDDYRKRLDKRVNTANHDLGFLYTLSAKAEYRNTGNQMARRVALQAAELLMERYIPQAGILQAWGDMKTDEDNKGRIIIDCLMNLPLLFWATQETGDRKYRDAAVNHLRASRYLVRDDGTTFHTYYFDPETGRPLRGRTHQGYADDSVWARGQAWGIYGFCLNYRYTGDMALLALARKVADRYLSLLPDDAVPYWDMVFSDGDDQPRDSSAAAIAACGLFELSSLLPVCDASRKTYEHAALTMMAHLVERYTTKGLSSNGLLCHATQALPQGKGIDECCIFGDYFFMEALDRMLVRHPLFW